MVEEKIKNNALDLENELLWLQQLLDARVQAEFGKQETKDQDLIRTFPPPSLSVSTSPYAMFVKKHDVKPAERVAIMLAMAPYIKPQILDVFLIRNSDHNKQFTEFGGIETKQHKGFVPTGQTLLFLLAGNDLSKRFSYMRMLESDSMLIKNNCLSLESPQGDEPFTSGALVPARETVELFTKGESYKPLFNASFPAKRINTELTWEELVLADQTMVQLKELNWWLSHAATMMGEMNMQRKIKPGYRTLFYGPPGTGKTLTAALIGKQYGLDVYRIDLSKVVSKYIGETEKNLASVFDRAENKNWVLFFDEADALFGKRTNIQTSNDRHANQEVSYLLQRIEDYNGLVILASNLKSNIDEAFLRRFQSVVYFPMPKKEERYTLWKSILPGQCRFEDEFMLDEIAEKYEVAGGTIINVMQYCTLKSLQHGTRTISRHDFTEGINRELVKMGRTA